jgi:hypothetical protein
MCVYICIHACICMHTQKCYPAVLDRKSSACIQLVNLLLTVRRVLPTCLVVCTLLITTAAIDTQKNVSEKKKARAGAKGWRTDPYCCERIRRQNKTQASTISANDVPIAKAIAIATAEIEQQHMQSER